MTKRIISLVLVCILAIPILAVPASASQVTGTQFDQFTVGLGNLLNDIEYNILDALGDIETYCYYIYNYLNDWIYTKLADIETAVNNAGEACTQMLTRLINTLAYHFENLQTWISEQTTALLAPLNSMKEGIEELVEGLIYGSEVGQSGVGTVESEVNEQTGQYDDAQEVIQEATRPDVEDVDVNITGKFTVDTRYNNVLLTMFANTSNPRTPVFYVYFFALTLSLVSYGIFGKR